VSVCVCVCVCMYVCLYVCVCVCVYVCAYVSRLWVCTVLARYQMKTPDWNGTTVVLDTLSKRDDFEFEKSGAQGRHVVKILWHRLLWWRCAVS